MQPIPIAPRASADQANLKRKLERKRSIRAIDQGTMYDIPGMLRKAARTIARDPRNVTDVVLIERRADGSTGGYHWGTGGVDRAYWMASQAAEGLLTPIPEKEQP